MGRGLIRGGSLHFRVTTITDRRMPRARCAISVLSLGCHKSVVMGKTREKQPSRHNMTQIASLLAVATVIVGLWTLDIYIIFTVSQRGASVYAIANRETKLEFCRAHTPRAL